MGNVSSHPAAPPLPLSPGAALRRARQLVAQWGTQAEANFGDPLTRLLVIMHSPNVPEVVQVRAAELALPFYHSVPTPAFDLTRLRTAEQMLEAQRRIMRSIGDGTTPASLGKQLIESLAIMIRSLDTTVLEDRLEAAEARANAGDGGRPQLTVINSARMEEDDP
jgi:hypothetical protein